MSPSAEDFDRWASEGGFTPQEEEEDAQEERLRREREVQELMRRFHEAETKIKMRMLGTGPLPPRPTTNISQALAEVNTQIEAVTAQAEEMDIAPAVLRDANGSWVLIPLLAAKAQLLHAQALERAL